MVSGLSNCGQAIYYTATMTLTMGNNTTVNQHLAVNQTFAVDGQGNLNENMTIIITNSDGFNPITIYDLASGTVVPHPE